MISALRLPILGRHQSIMSSDELTGPLPPHFGEVPRLSYFLDGAEGLSSIPDSLSGPTPPKTLDGAEGLSPITMYCHDLEV
jgi:hypothetical protein